MKKSIVFLLALLMTMLMAAPANAGTRYFPERDCIDTFVGMKSYTSGTTKHYAFHNPPGTYLTGSWNNGGSFITRSSVANHYHVFDSYGYGGKITYGGWSWHYNYCTWFA